MKASLLDNVALQEKLEKQKMCNCKNQEFCVTESPLQVLKLVSSLLIFSYQNCAYMLDATRHHI